MTEQEVLSVFESSQALLSGHFILSSGNHSNQYLQCALVTQHPGHAARLADALAARYRDQAIDVVLGPALGGIVIAQEVAHALYRLGRTHVRALFCERVEGRLVLRRGFAIHPGERVLAVEDVVTTGGSVREAVELAQGLGGQVVGVGSFVDRSGGQAMVGAPLHALLTVSADIYTPQACPLCQAGSPASKPGSRDLTK